MLRNVRRSRRLSNGTSASAAPTGEKKRPLTAELSTEEDNEIDELHADIFGKDFM